MIFKISKERIRQIETKALMKLRSPKIVKYLLNGVTVQKQIEQQEFDEKKRTAIENLKEKFGKDDLSEISLWDLEFSARAAGALWRREIKTVADLIKFSPKNIEHTKNIGKITYSEIMKKCEKFGIELV